MKGFIAGILCVASLAAVSGISAAEEYILVGGKRAVISGNGLIVIDARSRSRIAEYGVYNIRGGNKAIFVTKDGVRVGERPKVLQ